MFISELHQGHADPLVTGATFHSLFHAVFNMQEEKKNADHAQS